MWLERKMSAEPDGVLEKHNLRQQRAKSRGKVAVAIARHSSTVIFYEGFCKLSVVIDIDMNITQTAGVSMFAQYDEAEGICPRYSCRMDKQLTTTAAV